MTQNWWETFKKSTENEPGEASVLGNVVGGIGSFIGTGSTGNPIGDLAVGAALRGTGGFTPNIPSTGYTGSIPDYEVVRERVPTDPNRRRGGENQRYFTDTRFAKIDDDYESVKRGMPSLAEQQAATTAQRQQLMQRNMPNMAQGGIAKLAQGRYLDGSTDGMADVVPARIDGGQEARLSDGEFVIPADVVSHLGNGNSDAGAKELHNMMDSVRQARTGRKEQGIEINPDKFMPKMASGGIAKFSNEGEVKAEKETEVTGDIVSDEADFDAQQTGTESSLAKYVGPYVTDMLGRGAALADTPYQEFQGPLTADIDPLQTQAFTGIAALQPDAANMGVKRFDAAAAQQYMNPYIQAALNPQLQEAARQAEIQRQQDASRLTQAGAFGGSRQALIDSERARNLGDLQAKITGEGYRDAYSQGLAQFNREQDARNRFGFDVLGGQATAGATRRGIAQEGLGADISQFEEERDFPYKQVQYMQSLLQGLPLKSQSYTYSQPSTFQQMMGASSELGSFFDFFNPDTPAPATDTMAAGTSLPPASGS